MTDSGHELRDNNEKIVRLMALLKKQRDETNYLIEKQELEKGRIQNEIEKLSFKLTLVGSLTKSLNQRIQARTNYDRTIREIEDNYTNLVEESGKLLFNINKEVRELEQIMDKKIGTTTFRADETKPPERPLLQVHRASILTDRSSVQAPRSERPSVQIQRMERPSLLVQREKTEPERSLITSTEESEDESQSLKPLESTNRSLDQENVDEIIKRLKNDPQERRSSRSTEGESRSAKDSEQENRSVKSIDAETRNCRGSGSGSSKTSERSNATKTSENVKTIEDDEKIRGGMKRDAPEGRHPDAQTREEIASTKSVETKAAGGCSKGNCSSRSTEGSSRRCNGKSLERKEKCDEQSLASHTRRRSISDSEKENFVGTKLLEGDDIESKTIKSSIGRIVSLESQAKKREDFDEEVQSFRDAYSRQHSNPRGPNEVQGKGRAKTAE